MIVKTEYDVLIRILCHNIYQDDEKSYLDFCDKCVEKAKQVLKGLLVQLAPPSISNFEFETVTKLVFFLRGSGMDEKTIDKALGHTRRWGIKNAKARRLASPPI